MLQIVTNNYDFSTKTDGFDCHQSRKKLCQLKDIIKKNDKQLILMFLIFDHR